MASIKDVVDALGRRDGVEAVIILGNDGLPIASHVADGSDPEVLSAVVPGIFQAAETLGHHAGRGNLTTGVIEYKAGYPVVARLSAETQLLMLFPPRPNARP